MNNDLNIYIVYNNVHFEPFVGINSYMNSYKNSFPVICFIVQNRILYRAVCMIINSISLNNLVLLSYTNIESLFHSIQFAFRGFSFSIV